MKRWPLIIAFSMLLGTWGILDSLSHGEPVSAKEPFAEFPRSIAGRWQGRDLGLPAQVLDVLRVSDYMMRVYVPVPQLPLPLGERTEVRGNPRDDTAPVYLYVGYYASQRTGATYHSPRNCLPGAGWQFVESEQVSVRMRAEPTTINKVLVRKGGERQLILYWYQDRGRVIASEYWAKAYLIWDAMTKNRTDGALVRISIPVTTTPERAYQDGLVLLRDLVPVLNGYLPGV